MPLYDAVPADLYWIRHIDCGCVLRAEGEWRAIAKEDVLAEAAPISTDASAYASAAEPASMPTH